MHKGYVFVCFLGSCIFGALTQDCGQQDQQKLQSCTVNYMNFMKNLAAGQSSGSIDPSAIMSAVCSETGKTRINCYLEIFKRCPSLIPPQTGRSSMGVNMTDMMNKGGIDSYCDLMTGPCAKVMDCFKMMPTIMAQNTTPRPSQTRQNFLKYMAKQQEAFNEAKSYLAFQLMSDALCGVMKPLVECVGKELDQCLAKKDEVTAKFSELVKQSTPPVQGVKIMNFDEQLDFLRTGCSDLPKGFATSECLQEQMMTSEFTTCHKNFEATYKTSAEKKNCKAYDALSSCFSARVEPECGADVSSFMAKNTPLIVDGIASSCVPQTSGSIKPLATSGIILGIGLAVLVL